MKNACVVRGMQNRGIAAVVVLKRSCARGAWKKDEIVQDGRDSRVGLWDDAVLIMHGGMQFWKANYHVTHGLVNLKKLLPAVA